MKETAPQKKGKITSYLLRLEPSSSGEHVLLTDLISGERLEFDSLEEVQAHLTKSKIRHGLR